jgi:O-antigen/teichoic acid export membrane protein
MTHKNYWIKNGLINVIQNFSGQLLGMLSFILLVRVFSKEDYGIWVIFLSIVNIVELSKNGFTQEATIKYLSSANRADKRRITTASFVINIVLTIILCILLLLCSNLFVSLWKSTELVHMLYISIIMFFISGVLAQLNYAEQSNLSFRGNFYSFLTRQLLFFLFIGYCYITHHELTLTALAIAQTVTVAIATLVAYFLNKKYIKFTYRVDMSWVKKIFNFGKYTFGIGLTSVISGSIDQMMLGSMLSKAASGSFNVAVRITGFADIPITAMASIVFPQSALRMERDGVGAVKYLYERSVGVILGILTPCVILLFFFSDYLLFVMAGHKYDDALPLLKITLLTCILYPYGRQAGTVLASAGKVKYNFVLMIINVGILIILNYFFIKSFGVIGAAYATLISSIISVILNQIVLYKLFKINVVNPWIYAVHFYGEFINLYIKKKRSN